MPKARSDKPSHKQIKAVDRLVENGGNITEAMRVAEYSENTIHTPQKLTESKGFKMLMAQSGLTEELIATALIDDIKAKPQNRIGELNLGAKILKMTDENKMDNFIPVQIVINQIKDETTGEESISAL